MKPNLLLLSVILLFFSCSKNKSKSDISKESLNGNVSKITVARYRATEKFGEPYKEKRVSLVTSKFNKDGNITDQDLLYTLDSSEVDHIVFALQYNDKGQKISSRNMKNPKPTEFYKYDSDGLVREYIHVDDKGTLTDKTVFVYDNDLASSETSYDNKGGIEKKITYKRNEKGLLKESTEYDSSGKLNRKMLYSYNTQNLLEKLDYSSNTGYAFVSTFKYSDKDDKGNYLKIVTYEKNKPVDIVERKIEYY